MACLQQESSYISERGVAVPHTSTALSFKMDVLHGQSNTFIPSTLDGNPESGSIDEQTFKHNLDLAIEAYINRVSRWIPILRHNIATI